MAWRLRAAQTLRTALASSAACKPHISLSSVLRDNTRTASFGNRQLSSLRRWTGSGGIASRLTPNQAVISLVAANVLAWTYWQVNPSFMLKHFTVSVEQLYSGRLYTLITAAFSHKDGVHLFNNMFTLYFFGKNVAALFGPRILFSLYLSAAVVGNMVFLGLQEYHGRKYGDFFRYKFALGASGAVNGIIAFEILLFPRGTVLLYGVIPVPTALFGSLWLLSDVYGAIYKETFGNVSHTAHLGGAAVGAVYYVLFRRGLLKPRSYYY